MIIINKNSLEDAIAVSQQISEFKHPYGMDEYQIRLKKNHLILTASIHNKLIGFKIGYDRFEDGSFYSWMGGVLPEYRKKGIAKMLANYQEKWAKENKYTTIRLKTRKKYKAMVAFSLKRGFKILNKIAKVPDEESRIWMEKQL
ncbi:MAG: GNAT family N-acetyltransferase [Candidatus Marinimicrobia bacterium]|nr:GNAT family N-acetyltransferase [Candidatus Neomarinimicrobiota bacterium]